MFGLLAFVLIIWLLVIQNKIGDIEAGIRSIDKENRMRLKNIKTELKNLEEKLKSAHFDNTPPEPQIQTSKEVLADKEEDAVDFDEIIPDSVKSEKPHTHYEYATQINTPTEKEQEQEKIIIREQDFQPSERVKIREQNFQQKEEFDFENAFLGNIFNKIGAIVLIIGIGFFISIISKYIIFTPFMKICFAFILGLGMICGANQMKESEKLKAYSEVLMGTGFSVLFLTVFYASAVFKMFNSLTTAIIAGIILICTYFEAERQKTNSMVVIALLGGYLT
ncbi:MAG: DUF2339 domain-containing protein, partial [Candidatus Gastranaerophilales bacterium]|nr:DUF2339 domain-containing protein [Candidatus Gastranaerophilales bacterium]